MPHTSLRRSGRLGGLAALFLLCACHDKPAPSGGGTIIDDDAEVDDDAAVDAAVDAAGADAEVDAEVDASVLIGDGNCTGDVFRFDGVRSSGRRLSLITTGDNAHLVYPTPSCNGTASNARNQALSYVSLGVTGEPSAPRVLVNGDKCANTRDPALYVDGTDVRVLYTTNAVGAYDLASVSVDEGGGGAVSVTNAAGTEVDTAVARFGTSTRAFFSREDPSAGSDTPAPIVSYEAAAFSDTVSADAKVRASELTASPLLDGAFGAIAFPSAMSAAPGVYLTMVEPSGSARATPVLLTSALGAGSAAALANNDDGGAVIYSEVPGGTAHQLRFRAISRTGEVGAAVKLTTANQDLRDLALAPFHGGYLAAYRRISAGEGLGATMRLLFVDEVGNVKMTGYVADASGTAGTTQLAVGSDDNTFFVAWSNVESVTDADTGKSSVVEHVNLARFSCTDVPKLTCDK